MRKQDPNYRPRKRTEENNLLGTYKAFQKLVHTSACLTNIHSATKMK